MKTKIYYGLKDGNAYYVWNDFYEGAGIRLMSKEDAEEELEIIKENCPDTKVRIIKFEVTEYE